MKIQETNCETGETVERNMTTEEQAVHQSALSAVAIYQQQKQDTENAKNSAHTKLQALGLTQEEIQAIIS
jgi:hypothetical protein